MKLANKIPSWQKDCDAFLAERGFSRQDVKTGKDAWMVAHNVGICREAYEISRDIVDAHIQTALQQIFPNAVFQDPKRY